MNTIKFSNLQFFKSSLKKVKVSKEQLKFGTTFTDHLLEVNWNKKYGWGNPIIRRYKDFSISPAASVFHYGLEAFEGMKAYLNREDNICLFRPEMNMERFKKSSQALFFPDFDSGEYLKCIEELLKIDKDWIPKGLGYSVYIRPTIISTEPTLSVSPTNNCKLYTILSPVGPYYSSGFNSISLLADTKNVRAWPGGTGDIKIGGNYAPTIRIQNEASNKGYSQILWLFGENKYITEVGTMNVFFLKENNGNFELITAPLDGTILPGVTRDSIIQLTKELTIDNRKISVVERNYSIDELICDIKNNKILEAFGTGTAAIVSPINLIEYNNNKYCIHSVGDLTDKLYNELLDIQYGFKKHKWCKIIDSDIRVKDNK